MICNADRCGAGGAAHRRRGQLRRRGGGDGHDAVRAGGRARSGQSGEWTARIPNAEHMRPFFAHKHILRWSCFRIRRCTVMLVAC